MAYQLLLYFAMQMCLILHFSERAKHKREPALCVCYLGSRLCKLSKKALDANAGGFFYSKSICVHMIDINGFKMANNEANM